MKTLITSVLSLCTAAVTAAAQIGGIVPPTPPTPPAPFFLHAPALPTVPVSAMVMAPPAPPVPAMPDMTIYDQDSDSEVSKSFTKTFTVNNSDKLSLSNRYGTMIIKTWDRKEVKVDVDIRAYSTSNGDAQRLLDGIRIESGKTGEQINVRTEMASNNGNYGKNVRNGKVQWRREVKVNYTVYMPASLALSVAMAYGNVQLDNFSGPTSLKIQYGNLTTGDLRHNNNYISAQYGNVNAQNVRDLDLNVQYAGHVTINSVNDLNLNSQYSEVKILNVNGAATIKQQYNKLTIGTVNKLSFRGQYAGLTIGTLKGDANVNMTYENIRIDNILASANNITFMGNYASFTGRFADNTSANLMVATNYGSFKYGENVSVRQEGDDERRRSGTSRTYSGRLGKGGNGMINLKTNYGSVTLR